LSEIGNYEDVYEMEDFRSADSNVENTTHKFDAAPKTDIDLASPIFHQEYEEYELRIFQLKNWFAMQYLFLFISAP
jgi:hypothetical protein